MQVTYKNTKTMLEKIHLRGERKIFANILFIRKNAEETSKTENSLEN